MIRDRSWVLDAKVERVLNIMEVCVRLARYIGVLVLLLFPFCLHAAQEYRLGPGDTVGITIYEQPDLATTARISELGRIIFPLIGEAEIGSLTIKEAETLIETRLMEGKFIRQPQATITVKEYRSQQVSILGKVNKPGQYSIEGATLVTELLAQAGGRTTDAGDVVFVVRKEGEETIKHEVDLVKFYSGDLTQNMGIGDGDLVLVPKMHVFYIFGEVRSPGVNRLENGMTVMQALSVGGGLTNRGTQRGLKIERRDENGKIKQLNVKLTDILKPDDVLIVKERLF